MANPTGINQYTKGGGSRKSKPKAAKRVSVWDSMSPKQQRRASSMDRQDAARSAKKNRGW